ncbi:hypothetical protein [Halalkalibacter akibai]|nr:hypothetical protein [Halalkalibacter akibai]
MSTEIQFKQLQSYFEDHLNRSLTIQEKDVIIWMVSKHYGSKK